MTRQSLLLPLLFLLTAAALPAQPTTNVPAGAPRLERRGQVLQMVVDGKPFLMLAGELNNSSSSSLRYMQPEWAQLAALGLNTVLTPVSWELVEPEEGRYDFTLVDGLLQQARREHLHLVLLWLAAWKNGMSSYPPVWVKQDPARFPRVMLNGAVVEVLSPMAPATAEADGRALAALTAHLKTTDTEHTVLMLQVENEVGILGASRDHSPAAERAFAGPVPAELLRHLAAHRGMLNAELRALWEGNGARTSGTWTEVFGDPADTTRADEIFMAWQYARYVQTVAARAKGAYALPLYVNAWLGNEKEKPGDFPSGGPKPRVMDVWKAAGSSMDLYSPDLYSPDVRGWCALYHRPENALFIPETNGGAQAAANVFFAVGEHAALGFSPFAIDAGLHAEAADAAAGNLPSMEAMVRGRAELSTSYKLLAAMMPELLAAEEKGEIHGFVLDKTHSSFDFAMGDLIAHVSLDEIFGNRAQSGYGLILATGPNAFLGAGKGFRVSFTAGGGTQVGLASVEEGTYEEGKWTPGRRLNGDEDDQGRAWRFDQRGAKAEKVVLYRTK
ncbi:MAG TPA: DUF5597 domain-containing protein [Acidobacteriaceae bacterium]